MDQFVEKDRLLQHFKAHQSFPGERCHVPAPTLNLLLGNLVVFTGIAVEV